MLQGTVTQFSAHVPKHDNRAKRTGPVPQLWTRCPSWWDCSLCILFSELASPHPGGSGVPSQEHAGAPFCRTAPAEDAEQWSSVTTKCSLQTAHLCHLLSSLAAGPSGSKSQKGVKWEENYKES